MSRCCKSPAGQAEDPRLCGMGGRGQGSPVAQLSKVCKTLLPPVSPFQYIAICLDPDIFSLFVIYCFIISFESKSFVTQKTKINK